MYRYISSRTFGFGHMWTDGSHDIFEPYMTTQELLYKTKWGEGDTETNAANKWAE